MPHMGSSALYDQDLVVAGSRRVRVVDHDVSGTATYLVKEGAKGTQSVRSVEPGNATSAPSSSSGAPVPAILRWNVAPLLKG